eukprot:1879930-Amphidinium_carterae.1
MAAVLFSQCTLELSHDKDVTEGYKGEHVILLKRREIRMRGSIVVSVYTTLPVETSAYECTLASMPFDHARAIGAASGLIRGDHVCKRLVSTLVSNSWTRVYLLQDSGHQFAPLLKDGKILYGLGYVTADTPMRHRIREVCAASERSATVLTSAYKQQLRRSSGMQMLQSVLTSLFAICLMSELLSGLKAALALQVDILDRQSVGQRLALEFACTDRYGKLFYGLGVLVVSWQVSHSCPVAWRFRDCSLWGKVRKALAGCHCFSLEAYVLVHALVQATFWSVQRSSVTCAFAKRNSEVGLTCIRTSCCGTGNRHHALHGSLERFVIDHGMTAYIEPRYGGVDTAPCFEGMAHEDEVHYSCTKEERREKKKRPRYSDEGDEDLKAVLSPHYWSSSRDVDTHLCKLVQYPDRGNIEEWRVTAHQELIEDVLSLTTLAVKKSQMVRVLGKMIQEDTKVNQSKLRHRWVETMAKRFRHLFRHVAQALRGTRDTNIGDKILNGFVPLWNSMRCAALVH